MSRSTALGLLCLLDLESRGRLRHCAGDFVANLSNGKLPALLGCIPTQVIHYRYENANAVLIL